MATFVAMLFSIVPHYHHHDGAIYFVAEHHDKDTEDKCDCGNTDQNRETCVVEMGYYLSGSTNRVKSKVPSCDHCNHAHHIHFFPILLLAADFLTHPVENTIAESDYGEYILLYTSAQATQFHGLRAPPTTHS